MVAKNCIAVSLGLLSLGSTLQGVVAQFSKNDKKIFDSLVDVSFTKSSLATKARKDKRVEDLSQLAALMVRRLVNIMDGSGLKKEFNTPLFLKKIITPVITDATEKTELMQANRFAVYEFEKSFEYTMEMLFQGKLNALKARTDDVARELKVTLAAIMVRYQNQSRFPSTLLKLLRKNY